MNAASRSPTALPFPDHVLHDLLAVSLTALHVVRPLYAPDGTTITDFALEYLNPAAQRMTGLPERPDATLLDRFPQTVAAGILAYYRRVFETGEQLAFEVNYQADGLDNYFKLSAQRSGEQLVVSFTDTSEQDRSAVEVALRESQAREQAARAEAEQQRAELQRLFAQAPAAIAIFRGPQYVIELVNDAHLALWGRTREQVFGRPLFEAIPESVGLGFEELLAGVVATGQPYMAHEASARLRRHGQWEDVFFNFVYQPLRQADGRISGVVVVAHDVTDLVRARRQAEQFNQELEARVQERTRELAEAHAAAERQRAYLERVLRDAPVMINTQLGPKHVFDLVHPLTYQLLGHRPLTGLASRQALPELEGPFHELLDRVYQTGEPFHGTAVPGRLDRDGTGTLSDAYFDFTYQPLRNAAGQVEGIITYAVDVTAQVQARRRTEEATAELRLLAAHAPAFLFRTDAAGHITYANEALFEWSGLERAQLASLDEVWQMVHPDDDASQRAGFEAAVRAGRPWESPPYRIRRRDGQYRWSLTRTQPNFGPDGAVAGHSGITLEAHEQVELQHQLARTNADLDNFIYIASHDLKAPIANIEGLLHAVEHELPPAGRVGQVPFMLGLMHTAIERFGRTIAHLTDISRLQQEHNQPAVAVSLARVVREVQLDLDPLLTQTQAHVAVHIPEDVTLRIAEKNLRSVVYNLLSNALKYRHPERAPAVTIAYTRLADAHRLEVHDNGLGLDLEQHRAKLFGMFKRMHTHVEGSGVGLHMVKKIVENAGGRIDVESVPGQGSTFRVLLPG